MTDPLDTAAILRHWLVAEVLPVVALVVAAVAIGIAVWLVSERHDQPATVVCQQQEAQTATCRGAGG